MQAQSLKISSVKFFSKKREREREDTPNTQRISCA